MACFLVPAVEAVATTIVQKKVGKEKAEKMKLSWLNTMLWGGVTLLAIEHIWHGEVVPWPPFLTAMANPAEIAPMLKEMATVGSAMAIVVTLTWIILVFLTNVLSKRFVTRKPAEA
ncbi:MAG TPA: hypothetical protein ENI52_05780 [Thermoplasmata archaeon]|nr:hypothetical protein [Thermoplasmata archaeon]